MIAVPSVCTSDQNPKRRSWPSVHERCSACPDVTDVYFQAMSAQTSVVTFGHSLHRFTQLIPADSVVRDVFDEQVILTISIVLRSRKGMLP